MNTLPRIPKDFTDLELDTRFAAALGSVRAGLEEKLQLLAAHDSRVRWTADAEGTDFALNVYVDDNLKARLTVSPNALQMGRTLAVSFDATRGQARGWNDWHNLTHDRFDTYFTSPSMSQMGRGSNERLSLTGVADHIWAGLSQRLER